MEIKANKLQDIEKKIKEVAGKVAVGFRSETYNNGKNVSEVAQINEYGYGGNPPRPFMRKTLQKNKNKYVEIIRLELKKDNLNKSNSKKLLIFLGKTIVKDIKETISSWGIADPRKNKESTAKRKEKRGSSNPEQPLIDTGKMIDSVEWWMDK